jgi:hypothetical protein
LTYVRALLVSLSVLAALAACTTSKSKSKADGSGHPSSTAPATTSAGATTSPAPSTSASGHVVAGKTVAPPRPGNIHQTVSSRTVTLLTAKPVGATVAYHGRGVTASVQRASRVSATARIPGEIAGPAVSVQLRMVNRGTSPVGLGSLVAVTAMDAHGTPCSPITTSTTTVAATLRPGAATVGRYVFHLPSTFHGPVTIQVTYAATAEVARFVGSI